jgi:hypothetical protein
LQTGGNGSGFFFVNWLLLKKEGSAHKDRVLAEIR